MIDFSSEKYIILLGTGTPGKNNEDKMRSKGGTQSVDIQGRGRRESSIQGSKCYHKCIVKFLPEDQKVSKRAINSL